MESSHSFSSTQHAVLSPKTTLIASLTPTRLEIRKAKSLQLIRSISILPKYTKATIHWSPSGDALSSISRIALTTPTSVLILNISGNKSNESAKIEIPAGSGQIVGATFGSTDDEFLTFADFGSKVNVWSLSTGRNVEIKDPKSHLRERGYAFRPKSGHLVLLCRTAAQDVLMMLAVKTRDVVWTVALPTVDAQALSWSPDGMFLVVSDSASLGTGAYVYTSAGDLYRSYGGDGTDELQPGIKSMQWSTSGDMLALAGYDRRVRLLNTRTFTPAVYLDHTVPINLFAPATVWQEKVAGDASRTYEPVTQPITPPSTMSGTNDHTIETGVSMISYSADGSYLATKCDDMPTTIWIWDLRQRAIATTLIHHSPVKQFQWHPSIPKLLMMQCAQEQPLIYLWEGTDIVPSAWPVTFSRTSGKIEATWLIDNADPSARPSLLLGDLRSSILAWPRGRDLDTLREESEPEELSSVEDDGDESVDSVYQVLTGRASPFKNGSLRNDESVSLTSEMSDEISFLEDTFHGKKS